MVENCSRSTWVLSGNTQNGQLAEPSDEYSNIPYRPTLIIVCIIKNLAIKLKLVHTFKLQSVFVTLNFYVVTVCH